MLTEIREMMVYQAPPELGSLWSKFETMWQKIVAEQEVAHADDGGWRRRRDRRHLGVGD